MHPRMDVRVKAAAFLLRHRTEEAKAVLKEAAHVVSLASVLTLHWHFVRTEHHGNEEVAGVTLRDCLTMVKPPRRTRPARTSGTAVPPHPMSSKTCAFCRSSVHPRGPSRCSPGSPASWRPSSSPSSQCVCCMCWGGGRARTLEAPASLWVRDLLHRLRARRGRHCGARKREEVLAADGAGEPTRGVSSLGGGARALGAHKRRGGDVPSVRGRGAAGMPAPGRTRSPPG